jgi:hypothetical protein
MQRSADADTVATCDKYIRQLQEFENRLDFTTPSGRIWDSGVPVNQF